MNDPIPYKVQELGESTDAPVGAIPISLWGAGSGGQPILEGLQALPGWNADDLQVLGHMPGGGIGWSNPNG